MDTIHELSKEAGVPVTPGRIRMAYSLQYGQPVLCTLLCDQPLYYMEEDAAFEEDDSLFLEEQSINAALGLELGGIQKKISIYDETAKKFTAALDARLIEFKDNAAQFGARRTINHDGWKQDLVNALSQSRYAQSLMDFAASHDVAWTIDDNVKHAVYDSESNTLRINPEQNMADAMLMGVQALRTHEQYRLGADHHPLSYHPDEAILVNRAQAADRAVSMVRAAWELQLAGEHAPWARLENSQGSDMARSFAREALSDFRTLNNGKASQAAFESWFLSDRCKIEDRELIQAMLVDQEARAFTEDKRLSATFIAALGEQNIGKNYLSDFSGTILTDPIFSDVRDRSNANFLWFVKFERSYAQTEQAMETGAETIHSLSDKSGLELKNDEKSTYYERSLTAQTVRAAAGTLDTALNQSNVVYVSFGR